MMTIRRFKLLTITGLAFVATPAWAQESKTPASAKDDSERENRLDALLAEVGARIDRGVEQGFKGREALRAEMGKELESLTAIKDSAMLSKAIAAYQKRFGSSYREVLKAGGVDLSSAAKQMAAIMPGMIFLVVDGTHIIGSTPEPAAAPPPPPPVPSSIQIRGGTMDTDATSPKCGAIADGGVSFRGNGMVNTVWAAKVGGCEQNGWLRKRVTVAPGLRATVSVTARMELEVFVVGLGGAASARAGAEPDAASPIPNFGGGVSAFAPIFWADSESKGPTTVRVTGAATPVRAEPYSVGIDLKTRTKAYGAGIIWSNANAKADLRDIDIRVDLAP